MLHGVVFVFFGLSGGGEFMLRILRSFLLAPLKCRFRQSEPEVWTRDALHISIWHFQNGNFPNSSRMILTDSPPPFFSKTFFYISKWRASQIPKNLGGFMAAGRSRLCRRRRWDLHGRRSNAGAQAGFVTHLKDLKETGVFFLNFKQTKKDIFSLEFVAKNCPTFFFPWNLLQSVFIFWRFSNLGHSVFFSGSYVPTYKRVRRGAIKPEIRPLMEGSRSFCWWATPLKTNSPRKIPIELLANTIKMLDFPASYVSWCRSVTKKLKQHLLTLLTNLTADTALMVGCWISSYSTFSQCPGAIRCVWWTFDRILF